MVQSGHDRDLILNLLWLLVHRYDETADILRRIDPRILDGHESILPVVARLVCGEPITDILPDLTDATSRTLSAVVALEKFYPEEGATFAMCDIIAKLGSASESDPPELDEATT